MKQRQAAEIQGTTYMRQKQKPRSWPFQTVKLKKKNGACLPFCPQMGKGNFGEHNLIFETEQKPDYSRPRVSGRFLQSAWLGNIGTETWK